jgi:hypothetical protein
MRALILVVLGGVALYFAWSQFGAVDAGEGPVGTGTAEEGAEVASIATLQSLVLQEEEGSSEVQEPVRAEYDQGAVNPQIEASPDEIDELDLNALGDPLHEGALLVHRADDLQGYLKGPGQQLSANRKKLLIAYLLLARGLPGQVPKYVEGLEDAADVTPEEFQLLRTVFDGGSVHARDARGRPHKNPLILGASMSFVERDATEASTAGRWKESARLLSELLLTEIDAPWAADAESLARWSAALEAAQANHRWSPEGTWPSVEVRVVPGDTLVGIRKRLIAEDPSLQFCTGMIERSNQLGRYLREGQILRVPTNRVRTLIDLSSRWLFYLHADEVVAAYPVATGRVGAETTPGRYTVGDKTPEPPWFPKGNSMVPYGDPENPLGTRWIGLEGSNGLGIHGTWEPQSLGTMASDGCIRLHNDRVEELFEVIPQGSDVVVRP